MNLSLEGRTAVVCGSTQGIGNGIARELALLGAECLLLARNEERLKAAVEALPRPHGQRHGYRVADFTQPDHVRDAIAGIVAGTTVHILVNNTGGPAPGPITEAADVRFVDAFQQHLVNNHRLAQAVLPGMRAAGYGRIINVISTSVRIPLRNLGVSNTIRGAVASWAKSLSNEVAADGITVNSILPGFIQTGRLESLVGQIAAGRNAAPAEVAREMAAEVPVGRFGEIHEIAAVAAFLATPAASYVNGASIPVDGGRTGSI